jgi:hypothetical protein
MLVIIVGDGADPHVRAVADCLPTNGTVIVDATTLHQVVHSLDPIKTTLIDVAGEKVELNAGNSSRGWLRRLAPAGWDHAVVLGGHTAAVLASRLTLLAAVLRDPALTLATPVDDLFAAENKLVQYRAAHEIGIRFPATLVSGRPRDLTQRLGEPFVLKPLGPGNFEQDGCQKVVYVRPVHAADIADTDLLDAPFLAQSLINARTHLRVVTVGDQAWVAELDGADLPVDWRESPPAHHGFKASASWTDVEDAAVRLAARLGVGFSSQDWVVDDDGPTFLDLNPGGQWLFLPDAVTTPVARTLADWLARR